MFRIAFLLFLATAALAQSPVRIHWNELNMAAGKTVAIAMPDGASITGTAREVRPDGLVVEIRKTSDRAKYPKGAFTVPRTGLHVLEMHYKVTKGRIIGVTAGVATGAVVGVAAAIGANGGLFGRHGTRAGVTLFAVAGGVTTAGYFIGNGADRRSKTLEIVPD